MANKVQIINKALSMLGMTRITTIDDPSPQARAAKATWDITLGSVLSAGLFTFSIERVVLALTAEVNPFDDGYPYVYQVPTGCLRVVDFFPDSARARVEKDRIFSDTENLGVRIIVNIDDETLFFPAFAEALAIKLAADMAYPLINSAKKGEDLLGMYEAIMLPRAKSADSTQGDAPEMVADEWLNAKYG